MLFGPCYLLGNPWQPNTPHSSPWFPWDRGHIVGTLPHSIDSGLRFCSASCHRTGPIGKQANLAWLGNTARCSKFGWCTSACFCQSLKKSGWGSRSRYSWMKLLVCLLRFFSGLGLEKTLLFQCYHLHRNHWHNRWLPSLLNQRS